MAEIVRMNPEIKAKWLAALRSGEYGQGKDCLKGPGGFCCLGVLGDLMVEEGKAEWQTDGEDGQAKLFDNKLVLSPQVVDWAGLPSDPEGFFCGDVGLKAPLTMMNDQGATFEELAKIIEERL